jgi:MFS family permease
MSGSASRGVAERNRKRFIAFRVLFNARFYYPVLGVLFLDLGLSATAYTLLNFVWALVIVLAEVPSGALADRLGRKPLLVAAAFCMVFEMLALLVAPKNGGAILVVLCLANRVLSGIAEAMASGADESLAFDSLANDKRESEWPDVLASIMRIQSVVMPIAMLIGATVYDANSMNNVLSWTGLALRLDVATSARLPIALTLVLSLIVVWITLGMQEPAHTRALSPDAPEEGKGKGEGEGENKSANPGAARSSWSDIVRAGRWILQSPTALFAIVSGVLIDSVVRLFLTFGSVFYRLIDLPVASFGVIGAASSAIGIVIAPFARWLVRTGSLVRNYGVLAAITLMGLVGVALKIRYWGVLFSIPLMAAMMTLGYTLSNTLNAQVDSSQRATVLSFKGLVFNLGYGFVSLLFALALRALRGNTDADADQAFADALKTLPLWLVFTLGVLTLFFWRKRAVLKAK